MPDSHQVIVGRSQGSREQLTGKDESPVELGLDTIMPPLRLAELCELDQGRDLSLEYSKIGTTGTGVKIPLLIGMLSCAKAIFGFCEIDVPARHFILPAPSPPLRTTTNVRRALVSKLQALTTAALRCGEEAFATNLPQARPGRLQHRQE